MKITKEDLDMLSDIILEDVVFYYKGYCKGLTTEEFAESMGYVDRAFRMIAELRKEIEKPKRKPR